jgi:HSP20 family protein
MTNNSLVKTNGNLFPAIPSLLDDLFGRGWRNSSMADWRTSDSTLPAVNVRELDDAYMIEVAAPGMKRKDFTVEMENNVLTISSKHEDSHEEKDGDYTRREFSYQSFHRSFTLPQDRVNGEDVKARYVDGILRITVPKTKTAKAKPAKQIAVT